jgi:hypothetical protein
MIETGFLSVVVIFQPDFYSILVIKNHILN